MRYYDLPDAVGVDEAGEEDEGDKVGFEDAGLEVEVGWDEDPGGKEWEKAQEGNTSALASGVAGLEDIEGTAERIRDDCGADVWRRVPGDGVEDEDYAAVNHVPLIPGQIVQKLGNEGVMGYTHGFQHRSLPEATASYERRECVDGTESQYAFHWARHNAKRESMGVIFLPGLDVKGEERCRCH